MGYQIVYNNTTYSLGYTNQDYTILYNSKYSVAPIIDLSSYLKIRNVIAGNNITVDYNSTGVTINSIGGGGSGTITGATNGLQTLGKNIGLGGTLTGDTTIDLNNSVLNIDGSASSFSTLSVGNSVYVDGGFQYESDFGLGFVVDYGNNSCQFVGSSDFEISTTNNGGTTISTQNNGSINLSLGTLLHFGFDKTNGAKFTDTRTGTTAIGITYGADYSTNFKKFSLVDKNYVTGLTTTLLSKSNFNSYSASTLTNINSRLLTSAFNTYSGATATRLGTLETKYITGSTNIGTGNGLFTSVSNHKTQFKSLVAGSNITLTPSSTGITIASTSASVYGSEVFYSGLTTPVSGLTAGSFKTIVSKGFNLAGGVYEIKHTIKVAGGSAINLGGQILVDGNPMESGTNNIYRNNVVNGRQLLTAVGVQTLSAGNHFFQSQGFISSGTLTVDYVQIIITRIA